MPDPSAPVPRSGLIRLCTTFRCSSNSHHPADVRAWLASTGGLHVVQQLRRSVEHSGGCYLPPPKSGSSGTVDLDPLVAEHLASTRASALASDVASCAARRSAAANAERTRNETNEQGMKTVAIVGDE